MYSCINLHFTDFCNFHCKHCFVKKENCELSFDELKVAVDKIYKYFKDNGIKGRINLAGGEPLQACQKDIEPFMKDLEDVYGIHVTKSQEIWSNPDKISTMKYQAMNTNKNKG